MNSSFLAMEEETRALALVDGRGRTTPPRRYGWSWLLALLLSKHVR